MTAVESVFTTRAGNWTAPTMVEEADATSVEQHRLATSRSHAVLAWVSRGCVGETCSGDYVLWATVNAGDAWAAPEEITNTGGELIGTLDVGVDDAGNATLAFTRRTGSVQSLYASTRSAGGAWSAPVLVEGASGSIGAIDVAVAPVGGSVVVWEQSNGASQDLWWNRHQGNWGTPALLEASSASASAPSVAFDASGVAIAVWAQGDAVRSARFADGLWTDSYVALERVGIGDLKVAVSDGGVGYATWVEDSVVLGSRYAGAWSVPTEVGAAGDLAFTPGIAASSDGSSAVVWTQGALGQESIYAGGYEAGGWVDERLLEPNATPALAPSVAAGEPGHVFAAWRQGSNGVPSIWGVAKDVNGWGDAVFVEVDDAADAADPTVAYVGAWRRPLCAFRQRVNGRFRVMVSSLE